MAESQKNQTEKENIVELKTNIYLLSIIGEVEGHESLGERTKATRYEHILPALARAEEDKSIDGLLILLNTVGGDVEAGLAIAEMIASMRKPAVSLVLGGGHSIGVPLAVAADYSLIVPSATMVIHPVRTNGMFIGVAQTYRNMEKTQDRITGFVSAHSKITKERLEELMLDTKMLVKDVGTMLDGPQAVEEGLIDEVGGLTDGVRKLIVGGPMMGNTVPTLNLPITKNFGGFLALGEEAISAEETACIRCGRCLRACPMGLMPAKIDALVRKGNYDGAIAAGAMNCMECGSCTYACPAKRELTQSCRVAKAIARSKKTK